MSGAAELRERLRAVADQVEDDALVGAVLVLLVLAGVVPRSWLRGGKA